MRSRSRPPIPVRLPTLGATFLTVGAMLGAMAGAVACAADLVENDDLVTGQWTLTRLVDDDTRVDLGNSSILIDISSAESSIRINTPCHWLYGSFTFLDDGTASFTVPGSSTNDCRPADERVEDSLRAALEQVSSWTEAADRRLVFHGPSVRIEIDPVG